MNYFSKKEVRALLTVARSYSERDWLQILVQYLHGLRSGEVCRIRAGDLKPDADGHLFLTVARLKHGKKTAQRVLSSADPLFDERGGFGRLLAVLAPDDKVFRLNLRSYRYRFPLYCAEAGIPAHKRHPHAIRHSAAMHTLPAGVERVMQLLGHKNLSSTGKYLHVTDDEAMAAAEQNLLPEPEVKTATNGGTP